MARSEAYSNDNGPSHPYDMYPQGLGTSRAGSIATMSSLRHSSHQAPAHPYAMYAQDISSDGSTSEPQGTIPLGFVGLEQIRHRRLGAEGDEDGDDLEHDGHIEQLPPYTRFDENGGKPIGAMLVPPAGMAFPPRVAPQSMADTSNLTRNQPQLENNAALYEVEGSPRRWRDMSWSEWWNQSWEEKRKRRFCGVSFGLLLIAAAAAAVIVVVCAGVIGGFLNKQREITKTFSPVEQP